MGDEACSYPQVSPSSGRPAYYRLVVHGVEYQDAGAEAYEDGIKRQRLRTLERQAGKLGMRLVPAQEAGP